MLTLRLLGSLEVTAGNAPVTLGARKIQALLSYLARRTTGPVPRDTLCALLWADVGEEQARASLRTALSTLRKALGPAATVVESDANSVRLAAHAVRVDADEFTGAARSTEGLDSLRNAVKLYRGDFLEGLNGVSPEFDRWVEAERGALRSQHMSVLLRLADALDEAGETEDAIATLQRLLAEDPLQEHVHRRLIRAYQVQRRFNAAMKQYDRLGELLREELGVPPEPPTIDLIREVRRARSSGGTTSAPREASAGPSAPADAPADVAVPGRPSLAALPFQALGDTPDTVFFGEGIAEDTIVELARSPDLLVVARHSSFQLGETTAPEEIGRVLGVRFALSGSVRLAGGRARVTAHLVRCVDNRKIWAERYDRDAADIFEIQSHIARSVAGAVAGRITDTEAAAAFERPKENLEAYALVMRGVRHMSLPDAFEFHQAIDCFTRATELAPQNARAWSLLALSQIYRRWYFDVDTDVADLIPFGERAVRLDAREPRGHCALGWPS